MGFFDKLKSVNTWKAGKKHADNGNFEKALVYFDDAIRMATDQKYLYEFRTWYYLTKAISCCKSDKLEDANSSAINGLNELQKFKDECVKTGSSLHFNMSYKAMMNFMDRYDNYFYIINEFNNLATFKEHLGQ